MELTPETKVADLLDRYPFLLDFLVEINPHFENLKNPVLRETMAKLAPLSKAAGIAGMPVTEFIQALQNRIAAQGDQ